VIGKEMICLLVSYLNQQYDDVELHQQAT
jgi:hypothetical protein